MARPSSPCRFRSFFGCIPLERGVLIIGIFAMFLSLTELFKISIHLVDFQLSYRHCQRLTHMLKQAGNLDDQEMREKFGNGTEKCPTKIMQTVYFALGLEGILWIIYFVVSGLLVYGVKLRKPRLMLPWMVWQAAPIFYAVFSIFSRGFQLLQLNLVSLLIMTYFLLVVNSYYLELQGSADRTIPVTIVAVTQTPSGMQVNIPSLGKNDAPPPYPGYISESNPVYSSVEEVAPPPYSSQIVRPSVSPPPYTEISASNQQRITTEESAHTSSQTSPTDSPSAANREATPLVRKPDQSAD